MSTFFSDLRFAIRQLRRDPGFALVAILTLGVGIGATTVIFSIFNVTVLRKLPYFESERLVRLTEVSPQGNLFPLSEPNFLDYQERGRSFSRLVAVSHAPMTVAEEDESFQIIGVRTTAGLFQMLGAAPTIGGTFPPEAFTFGDEAPTVVIGFGLWENRFGAAPDVIGRTLELDGTTRTIIGVMPRGFDFPNRTDAWIPFSPDPAGDRNARTLEGFGRLAPGVSLDLAAIDIEGIASQLGNEAPLSNRDWGASLQTFHDWQIGPRAARIAFVLLGAVTLLLLLACASVSNLLLARTTGRQRELALRASLGALPPRILGQLIAESLVLAFLSAVVGLFLTAWALPVIRTLETNALPRLSEVSIDQTVVLFTLLVTVTTGFFCGAAPAFQASNEDYRRALRGGERIVTGGSRMVREVLVTFQLALAVVLLVGAGLLTNSFVRMLENEATPVAVIVGLFAAAALGLAALGIYGVTAFSVARRRREIGVRMALGAEPRRIIGIALSDGTKLILLGTGIGLLGAFGLSRFLGSMLYEIRPGDPFTYAAVTLVLASVAMVANYIPAHRATKIDPREAFLADN